MKIKSLKYNVFMNFLRIIFGMLSPLIVMPYINRKFEPKLIGEIEYSTTIISYFVLLAGLGISTYGVREIAKIREDMYERSKFVIEMSVILLFTNIVSYLFLFIIIYLKILKNINLQLVFLISCNILFTSFSFEWFYQGIEDQEYITKRTVLVKIVSIILIFSLIKNKNDSLEYVSILVGSLFCSNIFNIINLKKYIKIDKIILKDIEVKKHLKNLILMLGSSIAILIYSQIDILMIGDIVGTYYVGLYNTSVKILNLGKILITIVGATLLPRLTNLYFSNSNEQYNRYLKKTLQILIIYSSYCILFLYINSNEIIYLFGGKGFIEASTTLKIQSIVILFSGLAYFYGVIILYSQKKDKPFLYSVIIAAILNIILNKLLIPIYKQNGAVIATIIAELCVVLFIYILEKKEFKKINFININTFKVIGVMILILNLQNFILLRLNIKSIIIKIITKNILIFFMYTFLLCIFKEEILTEVLKIIRSKFKRS